MSVRLGIEKRQAQIPMRLTYIKNVGLWYEPSLNRGYLKLRWILNEEQSLIHDMGRYLQMYKYEILRSGGRDVPIPKRDMIPIRGKTFTMQSEFDIVMKCYRIYLHNSKHVGTIIITEEELQNGKHHRH